MLDILIKIKKMLNNKIISTLIIIWILFNLTSCTSEETKSDIVEKNSENKITPVYNYKSQITNVDIVKTNNIEKK
ncbi:MAG: hypothetical protein U9Q66_00260 [Patescibacteria group bacterium]|nr:hypothetical protein [Patescibacteria group bacterium]